MLKLEAKWPGGSWLLPGWLLTKSAKASPEGLNRYKDLIRLAEGVNARCVLRDVRLDDLARLMTASDLGGAIDQWRQISLALCERGGIVASIHARDFSQALLAVGYLEYASALI